MVLSAKKSDADVLTTQPEDEMSARTDLVFGKHTAFTDCDDGSHDIEDAFIAQDFFDDDRCRERSVATSNKHVK